MRTLLAVILTMVLFCVILATLNISDSIGHSIDVGSTQRALNTKQARQQDQAEWEAKMLEQELTLPDRIATKQAMWVSIRIAGPITITVICIVGLFLFTGWSKAEVQKAHFEATQLKMDPETRTYPLLVFKAGGHLRIHDANTKVTLALKDYHGPEALLTAYSTMVQLQSMAGDGNLVNPEVLRLPVEVSNAGNE